MNRERRRTGRLIRRARRLQQRIDQIRGAIITLVPHIAALEHEVERFAAYLATTHPERNHHDK